MSSSKSVRNTTDKTFWYVDVERSISFNNFYHDLVWLNFCIAPYFIMHVVSIYVDVRHKTLEQLQNTLSEKTKRDLRILLPVQGF